MKRNTQAIVQLAAEKGRLARLRVIAAIATMQAQGGSTSTPFVLPLAYQRPFCTIPSIQISLNRSGRYVSSTHLQIHPERLQ
jgi:hypothetical protein